MNNSQLSKLHRKRYLHTKKKALAYEESISTGIKSYRINQEKLSRRAFENSDNRTLLKSLTNSKAIYLGDFHTFDQSARNVLRILRTLKQRLPKKNFYLGLELAFYEHQKFIDAYLEGHITELEFLESINYSESWRFPWNHYRPLFDWAKQQNVQVMGLNSKGSLKDRDHFCAEKVAKTLEDDPEALFLVMFGEYHIVPNKIPLNVIERLDDSGMKFTIIHQNLDEVYWKQEKSRTKKSKIIKFNDDEFSLQNTLPWLKYESLVYWYESIDSDPDFDMHEYIIEAGVKAFDDNIEESFMNFLYETVNFLELNKLINYETILDYNLYDQTKLDYVYNIVEKKVPKKLLSFNKYLLQSRQVFALSYNYNYFCSNYSVNRLTYMVGIHLFFHLIDEKTGDKNKYLIEMNNEGRFLYFFQMFFMAYLCSKVFNPHRKSDLYLDYKLKLKKSVLKEHHKKRITTFISILDSKQSIQRAMNQKKISQIYEISRICGHFFAESFF